MRLKTKYRRLILMFLASSYLKPLIFVLCFICASSSLVVYFELATNEQFKNWWDGVWWTFVTFSTTGYGDKFPITVLGRIVGILTILIGIGLTTYLSGTMASVFVERNSRARRGLLDFPNLKDHFVICGWKETIPQLLQEIMRFNTELTSDQILILSNIDSEKIDELKEFESLKHLRYVKGDYFSEVSLRRANASEAKKIIVLADYFESHSPAEVDSKTVMTVLAIKSLSKDTFVCAEILDKKYVSHLKQAQCDEIIFARDYNQMILANATTTDGIAHIFYDLMAQPQGGSKISTHPIPQEFILKPYGDYRKSFAHADKVLMGVLKNTGSPNRMRLAALREAQKTSDVSKLVTNLQHVKQMEANSPFLLPADDFIIPKYSLAIVLERMPS